MRALSFAKYGPPKDLQVADLPKPEILNPDDVLIKVSAGSINPIDMSVASGQLKAIMPLKYVTTSRITSNYSSRLHTYHKTHPNPHSFPAIMGYDLSGTIEAVGSAVSAAGHLKPGMEVYSRVPQQHHGTIAEYAVSTAAATALKPISLTHVEAASIPLASLTALQALQKADKLVPGGLEGKTIYVPGGLSGVGATAVQLAKNVFGVKTVITTLSTGKISKAGPLLGEKVLDQVIDYTKQDPTKEIAAKSVDFMFDIMGQGMGSMALMKKGGVIIAVAGLPFGRDIEEAFPKLPFMFKTVMRVYGSYVNLNAWWYGLGHVSYFGMKASGKDLSSLSEWIDKGLVKTVVGATAKLDDIDAIRANCENIQKGKGGLGKFVIEV